MNVRMLSRHLSLVAFFSATLGGLFGCWATWGIDPITPWLGIAIASSGLAVILWALSIFRGWLKRPLTIVCTGLVLFSTMVLLTLAQFALTQFAGYSSPGPPTMFVYVVVFAIVAWLAPLAFGLRPSVQRHELRASATLLLILAVVSCLAAAWSADARIMQIAGGGWAIVRVVEERGRRGFLYGDDLVRIDYDLNGDSMIECREELEGWKRRAVFLYVDEQPLRCDHLWDCTCKPYADAEKRSEITLELVKHAGDTLEEDLQSEPPYQVDAREVFAALENQAKNGRLTLRDAANLAEAVRDAGVDRGRAIQALAAAKELRLAVNSRDTND